MRSFAEKARAAAWAVSLLSLLLVFVPKQVNAVTSFTECKFSSYQAFDVQWNISGENLNISGVTAPYDSEFNQPTIDGGDYFQFFESTTNSGTYGLKLFNSDGSLQQIMHQTGSFSALGSDFLFYQGSGFFGTVITTTQGLAYGSSATLPISQQNPTNEQVSSFASCSSTPIAQVGPAPATTVAENTTTTTVPQGPTSMPNAGFEDNTFDGWNRGTQTGSLGSSITSSGTGVSIFSGTRTFAHGSRSAVGNPTLPNGSPNPYYAPAVEAGSWTFGPSNGTYSALLQPNSQQTFAQAMAELGLSGSPETQLRSTLTSQAQASGFGSGNPTDAAWITREVQLTAGVTYTMNWNYVGTDYVPFNDGSITSLVAVTTPSSPTITVNNSVGTYAMLGFTNPGTGDYSTNSFGSTGWQISTYQVSVTGTYKLGFAVFNLDDTGLSPALMIDNVSGTTERCIPAGSNCESFGGVVSNNPTAPTVVATTTTTTPPTTTTTVPPTSLVVTSNADDGSSGTLRWAITQANAQNDGIYDSITFATGMSGTITLTSSLPAIVGSLTITGNGQTNTIIDGNNLYRPFWVGQGNSLTISNLTLRNGLNGDGGLIFNTKGTVSATNVRFTQMSGGTAVFNKEGGTVATYTNCTFDNLNIGIGADHGSTPSLPAGVTTWANQADSVFQNRTYVSNSTFSNNGAGINTQRFTKIQNSTFSNNSYGAALQGWNRGQILDSTFANNGIAIYHNSWISPTANMGTDNRLIEGNTFTNNGTAIYLDDTYNNGQKHQGWSTVRNNTWDNNGNWVVYYLWNGSTNAYGSVTPVDQTTVFSQSNNTVILPPYYNAVQNLSATTNTDGSVFLDWDAPSASNLQPHMYDVSWVDLVNGNESGGWGVWTYATNTSYSVGSFQFPQTTGYGAVRFKIRAGNAACVGEGQGQCIYGPYVTVDAVVIDPSASGTATPAPAETTTAPAPAPLEPLPSLPLPESDPQMEEETPVEQEPSTEETTPEETESSLPAQDESETEEQIMVEEDSSDNSTVEEIIPQLDEIAEMTPEEAVALVEDISELDSEQIAEVIEQILEEEITEELAIALVTSSEVLETLTQEQAEEIFSAIEQDSLTEEQASAIVAAVQNAPVDVKEAFESEINIYGGQFDNYVALGSTIDVGTRRAVIAVNLVTASIAVAATRLSSQGPSNGPTSTPKPSSGDLAARKEEEEDEGGEIAGDGLEWIKAISIYKLVNGDKVINWSAFMRKFLYSFMNLGFTIAGAIVLFYTLSGVTRTIAMWSFGLAFAAAMYLAMKEPEEG